MWPWNWVSVATYPLFHPAERELGVVNDNLLELQVKVFYVGRCDVPFLPSAPGPLRLTKLLIRWQYILRPSVMLSDVTSDVIWFAFGMRTRSMLHERVHVQLKEECFFDID